LKFRNSIRLGAIACLIMLFMGTAGVHADEALDDLAGRIEYAFYVADSRSLMQSLQAMESLQVADADSEARTGYLNYGRWKLAQLLAVNNPDKAQQWAQACIESKTNARSDSALALHQAIVAACLATLEQLRPLRSVLYRHDREVAIAHALQLGGKLVQVRLVAAWLEANRQSAAQTHVAIKQVVDQYSATDAVADSRSPGWGYAEACYLLGKAELARGDLLATRDALEQALVLAPEYRDARQLLQSLNLK